jgi:hypothetical protein
LWYPTTLNYIHVSFDENPGGVPPHPQKLSDFPGSPTAVTTSLLSPEAGIVLCGLPTRTTQGRSRNIMEGPKAAPRNHLIYENLGCPHNRAPHRPLYWHLSCPLECPLGYLQGGSLGSPPNGVPWGSPRVSPSSSGIPRGVRKAIIKGRFAWNDYSHPFSTEDQPSRSTESTCSCRRRLPRRFQLQGDPLGDPFIPPK